jgi:hypothetical protein
MFDLCRGNNRPSIREASQQDLHGIALQDPNFNAARKYGSWARR